MKKSDEDKSLFNADIAPNKDLDADKIKTTNVNILLNRVRLDQKRTLKKKNCFFNYSNRFSYFFSYLFYCLV